jgi:hypothetical protein
MIRPRRITLGQRFRSVPSRPGWRTPLWEVIEVYVSSVDRVEYARARSLEDRTVEKTIAVAALLDGRLYRLE